MHNHNPREYRPRHAAEPAGQDLINHRGGAAVLEQPLTEEFREVSAYELYATGERPDEVPRRAVSEPATRLAEPEDIGSPARGAHETGAERTPEAPRRAAQERTSPSAETADTSGDETKDDVMRARKAVEKALSGHKAIIPAAAAGLARELSGRKDPDLRHVLMPEDVKQEKPVLGGVSKVIGFFSSKAAGWFDNYIARTGQKQVNEKTAKVAALVETIGSYETPKEQFTAEVSALHEFIKTGPTEEDSRYFGKVGETPEDRLAFLFEGAADIGRGWNGTSPETAWLEQNCPLLKGALSVYMDPAWTEMLHSYRRKVKAVTPEILAGLEQFLGQPGSGTRQYEPVNPSLTRKLAQRYREPLLSSMPNRIVEMLGRAQRMLPENGPAFRQRIATTATEIATATSSYDQQTGQITAGVPGFDPEKVLLRVFDEQYAQYVHNGAAVAAARHRQESEREDKAEPAGIGASRS